jgi:hypothetical protein
LSVVDLFRVFSWDGISLDDRDSGPLAVPRARQGAGRHDNPDLYGAWYCARTAVSAVAEALQIFRGHVLTARDFVRVDGRRLAIARITLDTAATLVDLDDPLRLADRQLRPSQVATRVRGTTQQIARALFSEGAAGFAWWSSLEASWINVTLFDERVRTRVMLPQSPEPLTMAMPAVVAASSELGIRLSRAASAM